MGLLSPIFRTAAKGVTELAEEVIPNTATTALKKGKAIEEVSSLAKPAKTAPSEFGESPALVSKEGESAFNTLNITPEKKEEWRSKNRVSTTRQRLPEIEKAAQDYFDNKISFEEFQKLSSKLQPIIPLKQVPPVPSFERIVNSLTDAQVEKGVVGLNKQIKSGERVASRLDISAYDNYDSWVVSVHEGNKKNGNPIAYAKTAVLDNVEFNTDPKVALDIARRKPLPSGGKMGKATIARMFGDWVPHDPEAVRAFAEKAIKSDEWVQVGMNPDRGSIFYDKSTGNPILSASQIVQVGPLVLAKKDKFLKTTVRTDPLFNVNKEGPVKTFAEGGKVQAVEQTKKLFEEGGLNQEGGTVDKASGNDVPPGALQKEVRDDVDAKLSEGEFVFPADVVRYIGLEKLMQIRDLAKQGLQRMYDIGQMGNADEVENPEALHSEEEMDDETFSSEVDKALQDTGEING
jgi:hypothetical protein